MHLPYVHQTKARRQNELNYNLLAVADLSVGAGVIPIMSTYDITLDSSKDMWQFFIKKKINKDCCLAAPL